MNKNNDISGLTLDGFTNGTQESIKTLSKNETVAILRPLIRKYFNPTKTIYKHSSSYGLKHVAEHHLGFHVANGEFIYAMHMEGFSISRDSINCYFNISSRDIRCLQNAKHILEMIQQPTNREISEYILQRKQFRKYKYHFNFLIWYKFSSQDNTKIDVLQFLAKELHVNSTTIKDWFNILIFESTSIPGDKMEQLSKLFNMDEERLTNSLEN